MIWWWVGREPSTKADLFHVVGRYVPPAAHDTHNFDAVRSSEIKYDVIGDSKAAQSRDKLRSFTSGQWVLNEHLKHATDALDQMIRGFNAVRGYVAPDRIKISIGP
jgi:hypothetical protein